MNLDIKLLCDVRTLALVSKILPIVSQFNHTSEEYIFVILNKST